MSSEIVLPAALTSLTPLAEWLAQKLAPLPVTDEWRFSLDLAACETATNIIRHALHEDAGRRFVVAFSATGRGVMLCFTDEGETFPAARLKAARTECFTDTDPLMENGRGLKLILMYADVFKVENGAGKNVTTLEKWFST